MINVVRPGNKRSSACSISASEWLSRALVASSKMNARIAQDGARDQRCADAGRPRGAGRARQPPLRTRPEMRG